MSDLLENIKPTEKAPVRSKRIPLMVTEEDYEKLTKLKDEKGIKSLNELLNQMIGMFLKD